MWNLSRTFSAGTVAVRGHIDRLTSLSSTASLPKARFERTQSHAGDPKVRLDNLLGKLDFRFTPDEQRSISEAFQCNICQDPTTMCHQIRAVYDAFHLSWCGASNTTRNGCGHITRTPSGTNIPRTPSGGSTQGPETHLLSLADLRATVNKCEFGDEFFKMLVDALKKLSPEIERRGSGREGEGEEGYLDHPDSRDFFVMFDAKDFMVAFANALKAIPPERRVHIYRELGRMFGIEKVENLCC